MSNNTELEFWYAGEEEPYLEFNDKSMARVMRALIKLGGSIHGAFYICEGRMFYRISIPVGTKEEFEKLAGCTLTEADMEEGS